MNVNWFFIILTGGLLFGTPIGMAAVLIRDHIRKKRRERRCHRAIEEWWQMEVK